MITSDYCTVKMLPRQYGKDAKDQLLLLELLDPNMEYSYSHAGTGASSKSRLTRKQMLQ